MPVFNSKVPSTSSTIGAVGVVGPPGPVGPMGPMGPAGTSTTAVNSSPTVINASNGQLVVNSSNLTINGAVTLNQLNASRPRSNLGDMRWDVTSGKMLVHNGTQWLDAGITINPSGPAHYAGTVTNTATTQVNVILAPAATRPSLNFVVRVIDACDGMGRHTARWATVCEWLSLHNLTPGVDYDALSDTRYTTDTLVLFRDESVASAFRLVWAGEPSNRPEPA